eukprot:TRINITY_DN26862_c0_g1_i1.p1 TRINITY_DN26862_c0_g1~~TRINITY_DN26862_c0_g1_i1.p1  ORF type:complete len:277 (+),score=62.41 TRINITY_DN26862_c0_g1_i1:91-921(+)
MDLTPFKLDIDELVKEFTEDGLTTLADMKRVWLSRKFTFIYEARPTNNLGLFMQALYAHSIGYMISTGSLSQRLGGLYCLYCLYETQPFKPPFKIYLALGELKRLKNLVVDAKQNGISIVPALIKRMLEGKIVLFGFVDIADGSIAERLSEITKLQNVGVQVAYEKLLANTRFKDYLHMDLGVDLNLKGLKKMSSEYAKAKALAINEAGGVVEIKDVKHILENNKMAGDRVEKIAEDWNTQKEAFYRETGVRRSHNEEVEEVDDFENELVHLLTEN